MAYTVYKHTNKINGKVYIGITSREPEKRWENGYGYYGQPFYNAILKYGWENFEHEILFEGLTEKEAKEKEIEQIELFNSSDTKFGYNASKGGESANGMMHSEETKRKISNSLKGRESPLKGRRWSEERRIRISGENSAWYGKRHTEETKEKMRNSYHYHITDETRKRMSENRKGKRTGKENPRSKSVICIDTGKVYDTIKIAAEDTGANQFKISDVCRGKREKAGGLKWKYAVQQETDRIF